MKEDLIRSLKTLFHIEVILQTLAIIIVTWLFLDGIQRLFNIFADRFPRRRVLITNVFPLLRLVVWIGIIGFVLSVVIRPELKTLVALSATVGVALGLGAQEVVKNVLAGVLILMDRSFRVGDMIGVDSHYGEVTHIGLRTSRIRTFDDNTVTIPNGMFLHKAVINANSGELAEQVVVEFSLPGNMNVREIKALMKEAAFCSPYVYRKKPVNVLAEDRFDFRSLTIFKVKAYVMDVRFERLMAGDITERIKEELGLRNMITDSSLISEIDERDTNFF